MRAILSNYRQSPRKVRLVADSIRGKRADEALRILDHTTKRATLQLKKLLLSAIANAKDSNTGDPSQFIIERIQVNEGVTLKRIRPVSRGAAHPIRKRTSHVSVTLKPVEKK